MIFSYIGHSILLSIEQFFKVSCVFRTNELNSAAFHICCNSKKHSLIRTSRFSDSGKKVCFKLVTFFGVNKMMDLLTRTNLSPRYKIATCFAIRISNFLPSNISAANVCLLSYVGKFQL